MNKKELVTAIAEKSGLTQKDSHKAIDAFVSIVMESLKEGKSVSLIGFGTFEVRHRAARKGHNPATNEEIMIPATTTANFKAGQTLKDLLKNK